MKEILSDDEKQQKSRMEAQKASKELASPSEGQSSSQGEGSGPVLGEADLQDPGNEDKSVVKEVAKLNTKNKVQMKTLLEARDLCYEADKLSAQKGNQALRQLFPQQAPPACLYQEKVSLLWCQGVWEEELHAGGHLPLLQSAISECSFWLLPHPEASGTYICMHRL